MVEKRMVESLQTILDTLDDNMAADNPDMDFLNKRHSYMVTAIVHDEGEDEFTFLHYIIDPPTLGLGSSKIGDIVKAGGKVSMVCHIAQVYMKDFFSSMIDRAEGIMSHWEESHDKEKDSVKKVD